MNRIYARSLNAFLKRRIWAIPVTVIMLIAIGVLWVQIPAEMAPMEDRSQISINTRAAEGASYEYIRDYTEDINNLVDSIIPDAESVTARVSSGSGNIRITLKDIKDRDYTQMEVCRTYLTGHPATRRKHVPLCNNSLLSAGGEEVCPYNMYYKLSV